MVWNMLTAAMFQVNGPILSNCLSLFVYTPSAIDVPKDTAEVFGAIVTITTQVYRGIVYTSDIKHTGSFFFEIIKMRHA